MIRDTISFLKDKDKEVFFDAEHFFDGFKANADYTVTVLKAAEEAGADWLVLCDTNGGSMPWELEDILRRLQQVIHAPLGIHAHNDAGCAVSNSLIAVQNGCRQVQGTVNGYGEALRQC
jgi:2-isopropylmalate synthase